MTWGAKGLISATAELHQRGQPRAPTSTPQLPFAAERTQEQYNHRVMVKHVALSNLYFLRGFYRMG